MRRRLVIGTLLLAIAGAAISVAFRSWRSQRVREGTGSPKVRIGCQQTVFYLPVFVAFEYGLFTRHGIAAELVNFASAPEMMQALLAGRIDATGTSALDVIANVEQERPGQIKMYLGVGFEPEGEYAPDYVIVKPQSNISDLRGLKGKRFGLRPGITQETYAKLILRRVGINPDSEIQLVKLPESLQAQALQSGQVDALFVYDPLATIILENKLGTVLVNGLVGRYLMKEPTLVYTASAVFSAEFVRRVPQATRNTRDAIYEAVDFVRARTLEAKRILPRYTPIPGSVAEKVKLVRFAKTSELDKGKIQDMISLYHESGILHQNVDLKSAYLQDSDLQ